MKQIYYFVSVCLLPWVQVACSDHEDVIDSTPVTEVRIQASDLSLIVGQTQTLECTVSPDGAADKRVNWISLDPSVATVDERGFVTAISPGDTYILLNAAADGRINDRIHVVVREPDVEVSGIRIDEGDFSIAPGKTKLLTCTFTPANASDQSVRWTSLDPAIVSVDERGKVTAHAAGETSIIATSAADERFADTVSVEVTDRTIPVTQVVINEGDIALNVGWSVNLSCTVVPSKASDKSVTWESLNTQVATVDQNGKVTAIGSGDAQIVVRSVSDSEISNSITVNVTRVEITGMAIDTPHGYIYNGYTRQLTCTVQPAHAAQGVEWSSSNPSVASVDKNGLVRTHSEGVTTISATSVDGSGSQTSLEVTVLRPLTATYVGTLYGTTAKITILGITIVEEEAVYEENEPIYIEQLDEKRIRVRKEFEGVMYEIDCDTYYDGRVTQVVGQTQQSAYIESLGMDVTVRAYVQSGSYIANDGKLYANLRAEGKTATIGWTNLFKRMEFDGIRKD